VSVGVSEVEAHVGARDVPARREAGLEQQQRAVGVGDDLAVDGDRDVARAAQHVDAVVRVARVLEDLVVSSHHESIAFQ
jgi:hypothetical protein